jgi:hypothetical protein
VFCRILSIFRRDGRLRLGGADVQNLKENAAARPTSGCEAVKPLGDDDLGAEARGHGLSKVKLSNAREDCRSEMI